MYSLLRKDFSSLVRINCSYDKVTAIFFWQWREIFTKQLCKINVKNIASEVRVSSFISFFSFFKSDLLFVCIALYGRMNSCMQMINCITAWTHTFNHHLAVMYHDSDCVEHACPIIAVVIQFRAWKYDYENCIVLHFVKNFPNFKWFIVSQYECIHSAVIH